VTSEASVRKATARPAYFIESVDSALRLLHMFHARDRIRLTDVAADLQVAASTAHRLLAMLQYHGFVDQDARTQEYIAGPDLIRFGLAAVKKLDLRQQARPIMEALSEAVNETVALGVLQGSNVLYVDGVESSRALRVVVRTGALLPAHAIAMGKVLLASLPPNELRELLAGMELAALTSRTIVRKTELFSSLASIRQRGYAVSRGESEDGVASASTPVFNTAGVLRASISIAAPIARASAGAVKAWLPLLRRASAELGAQCR
jgi:IclR family acetate operon transcriptional repressor